jgi:hypothetical protein
MFTPEIAGLGGALRYALLWLFVSTQFRTQNRCALFPERLSHSICRTRTPISGQKVTINPRGNPILKTA